MRKRSITLNPKRNTFPVEKGKEPQAQYPSLDPMEELQWVTAPTPQELGAGPPKSKVKVIPIAKRKPGEGASLKSNAKGGGAKGEKASSQSGGYKGPGKGKSKKGKGRNRGGRAGNTAQFWSMNRKGEQTKGTGKGGAKGGKVRQVIAG